MSMWGWIISIPFGPAVAFLMGWWIARKGGIWAAEREAIYGP